MAHELEFVNGVAQMAYRESKGKPWHGLGTPIGDNLTPQEIMVAAGLNWEVEKVNTFINYKGNQVETGQQALVRSTDGKILTQVGQGWNPVQNSEAFDFFTDFVKAGDMAMDTAGSLKEGQIVWALADVRDGFSLFNGDEVRGYLLFSNPHQYGKSIDVRFVLERVVCNNTLTIALAETGQPAVRVNHRSIFDADRVKELLGLLMKHWNAVADGLQRSLGGEEVYMPVLLEDEAGIARGNAWAAGFMRGVSMRIDDWQVLFNDEEHGGPLVVIMMLLYENSPDPELRPPPIPDDKRADIHVQLTAGLALIYRYFEPHRRRMASLMQPVQQRRVGPKIGRNDPCPCGSGKKYKQCCGGSSTLH